VAAKDPAELTRDDAMTVACDCAIHMVNWACGYTGSCARAGVEELTWWGAEFMAHNILFLTRTPTDEANLRLGHLALEICRDPQGASVEAIAGAWTVMCWGWIGRAAVITSLVEAGVLEVAAAQIRKSTAVEWTSLHCAPGRESAQLFIAIATFCLEPLPGVDKPQVLLDTGLADAIVSTLKVRAPACYAESLQAWQLTP